jgi:SAM-dependent methyltransferase
MHATAVVDREFEIPQLPLVEDLFGQVLVDHHAGHPGDYYLRRDDNRVERDQSAGYFRAWEQMPAYQRCLLAHATGRVLDLAASAGQHALALQQRGLTVTAVDASPRAIAVCQARGVQDARVMEAGGLTFAPASFDSVLLLGNSLGVAGTPDGLRALLSDLHRVVSPGGQLLADFTDYSSTNDPSHLRYHRRNLALGRYPGCMRLRVEYQGSCGPEFNWLCMNLGDLRDICAETGWKVARCVQVNADASYAIGFTRV